MIVGVIAVISMHPVCIRAKAIRPDYTSYSAGMARAAGYFANKKVIAAPGCDRAGKVVTCGNVKRHAVIIIKCFLAQSVQAAVF